MRFVNGVAENENAGYMAVVVIRFHRLQSKQLSVFTMEYLIINNKPFNDKERRSIYPTRIQSNALIIKYSYSNCFDVGRQTTYGCMDIVHTNGCTQRHDNDREKGLNIYRIQWCVYRREKKKKKNYSCKSCIHRTHYT